MSTQSIIEHKANMHYVQLREDFLILCFQLQANKEEKSNATPYCEALMLSILESWTNTKKMEGGDLYVFMSNVQWREEMYGMFSRCVIIDSIEHLIANKLFSREPYKMFGKDSFKYLLNHKQVNTLLRALPEREPNVTRPKIDGYKAAPDPSKNRRQTRPKIDTTSPKIDGYPSKSKRNLESTLTSSQPLILTSEEEESTSSKDTVIVTENPPPPPILSSGLEIHETGEKPEEREKLSIMILRAEQIANFISSASRLANIQGVELLHAAYPTLTLEQFEYCFNDWNTFQTTRGKPSITIGFLLGKQSTDGMVRLEASLIRWEAEQRRAQMHVVSSSTNAAEEIDGVASLLKSFPHLNLISASEPARRGSL